MVNILSEKHIKQRRTTRMNGKVDLQERAKEAKRLILAGATWEQAGKIINCSSESLHKAARETWTKEEYNVVKKKAQENKRQLTKMSREHGKGRCVIVSETFSLIEMGEREIRKYGRDLFVPAFCVNELEQLAKFNDEAGKTLDVVIRKASIVPIEVEDTRSKKIIALCHKLYDEGFNVQLLVNSRGRELIKNLLPLRDTVLQIRII